ncbi:MAG TPA: glycogen/starch synthase [Bacteroidota bacterium]|nr:glycogen/starch synthase [Bacteroidota bacterium]
MPEHEREVVMVASENDGLKGGKVGGVGDVVRDLPKALARLGWRVTVIIPSYGFLHKSNPGRRLETVGFPFGGSSREGEIWELTARNPVEGVSYLVFEHPEIRGNPIYCHDPPGQAFAQDAAKYALFCSAVGQYLLRRPPGFVLHLHDWHTGSMFLLRELHPAFSSLKKIKTVFTIHNAAIQGPRPIRGKHATVEQWFPELFRNVDWISRWKDHRYAEPVFTPMAAGIRFAARVNTVSPTYAEEILKPSNPAAGFFGGEGLEPFLVEAKAQSRLFGILNGCEYPDPPRSTKLPPGELLDLLQSEVGKWKDVKGGTTVRETLQRIEDLRKYDASALLTSVTRVVDQKVRLLFERGSRKMRAIDDLLPLLSKYNAVYLVLGTGTPEYEEALSAAQRKHPRLLYLKGYSESIADSMYASGSLFIMPSLFEPCGISQMLAMREGQPCVVHAVGGLKDTVIDGVNGFHFTGATFSEKVDHFLQIVDKALRIFTTDRAGWDRISSEAAKARFTWESSARKYVELLYT